MQILKADITGKRLQINIRTLFVFMRKLSVYNYKNKRKTAFAGGNDTGADDWIIGGLSLSEHCKRMRFVEKNELSAFFTAESLMSVESVNKNSNVEKVLLEPAVF